MRNLWVIAVVGTLGCGPETKSPFTQGDEPTQVSSGLAATHLRLVAANLTTSTAQTYNDGSGARILQGLKPDITLMQEFNYKTSSDADLRAFVTDTFGSSFVYARGLRGHIPNGVISRYPIVESGDWADPEESDRALTWARIDVPGPHDLLVVSVHLSTDTATRRANEATALEGFLRNATKETDWVVIGGDFNSSSRGEAALQILSSVVVTSGPWPVDQNGIGGTGASRKKPLDWVLVSSGLSQLAVPTRVGSNSFPSGFVADTRAYSPISDLSPALASDSAGVTMQHMAVVRDFAIPSDEVVPDAGNDAGARDAGATTDAGTTEDAGTIKDAGTAPDAGPMACHSVTDVVISQVYSGGGGVTGSMFSTDFIELHNRSTKAAPVGGWAVQYSQTSNSSWATPSIIPPGTVIPPGGYLLVNLGSAIGDGATLISPSVASLPVMSFGASGGTVALTTDPARLTGCPPPSSNVIDLVGYGVAACRLTAATPPLSKTTAAIRRDEGCAQSRTNLNDFDVAAPAPKTSLTAPVICTCTN